MLSRRFLPVFRGRITQNVCKHVSWPKKATNTQRWLVKSTFSRAPLELNVYFSELVVLVVQLGMWENGRLCVCTRMCGKDFYQLGPFRDDPITRESPLMSSYSSLILISYLKWSAHTKNLPRREERKKQKKSAEKRKKGGWALSQGWFSGWKGHREESG